MMLNTSERFTYMNMRVMEIKSKLFQINPTMKEPDAVDILNVALIVFSYICDEHTDKELEHGDAIIDIIEDKAHFKYTVNDLIANANATNEVLNEYLRTHFNIKHDEVKK